MRKRITRRKILLWASGIVLGCFVAGHVSLLYFKDLELSGQYGDTFGFVNAILSGLALVGVIVAIVLQGHELELQRRELKLTRKELTRTAHAQEESKEALAKQVALMRETAALTAIATLTRFAHDRRVMQKKTHLPEEWEEVVLPVYVRKLCVMVEETFKS